MHLDHWFLYHNSLPSSAQAYQTCAMKHGNPCAEMNAAGIVGSGPGQKKDVSCCMKKEKHDRCLQCASMDCAHKTCNVNKKYYSTYTIVGKLDDKEAMKKAGGQVRQVPCSVVSYFVDH